MGCVISQTAYAQDFSIWEGKWFKINWKTQGTIYNEGVISNEVKTGTSYSKIVEWDNTSKEPRPQGGALKPKFSKPKTEIPKS